MTNPDTLEQRAERLLKDITPGEWTDGWLEHGGDAVCSGDVLVAGGMAPVDAAFIAAAPQLVRDLVAALSAVRAERDRRHADVEAMHDDIRAVINAALDEAGRAFKGVDTYTQMILAIVHKQLAVTGDV